jgi:hypothetical protein
VSPNLLIGPCTSAGTTPACEERKNNHKSYNTVLAVATAAYDLNGCRCFCSAGELQFHCTVCAASMQKKRRERCMHIIAEHTSIESAAVAWFGMVQKQNSGKDFIGVSHCAVC